MTRPAVLLSLLVLCPALLFAQGVPNADPTYQALRHVAVGSDTITVSNARLQRDAATFVFASGTMGLSACHQIISQASSRTL